VLFTAIMAIAAIASGAVVVAGLVTLVVFGAALVLASTTALRLLRLRRRVVRARRRAAELARTHSREAGERRWAEAHHRMARLQADYAGFECDALAVLRLPALADVRVAATARFVDAFAEAQALDTDRRPAPEYAERYVDAVDRACRAWRAARESAERIRLSGLAPDERARVDRVIKLLTMARDTAHDAERVAAYAKARDELARLDLAGSIALPPAARAVLDINARGVLTPAEPAGPA
jgi:hypothetical protein